MIDVEQRPLRPFEQHRLPRGHRLIQEQRNVAHPRAEAGRVLEELRQHRLPVHRRIVDQAVSRGHVVAQHLFEGAGVGQIADADAAARDFVFVGRPDAARRGADLAFAAPGFGQQVQIAVIRKDEMRLVADKQAIADVDPVLGELVDLRKERLRVHDDAVADDARDPGVKNAGGNQAEDEFRAVHVDRVAGIVSALIPRDDVELRREQIDDFSFAFVAPLGAEHCEIHRSHDSTRLDAPFERARVDKVVARAQENVRCDPEVARRAGVK